jgi:CubicO group peptidase (beta-lactamase class C family)
MLHTSGIYSYTEDNDFMSKKVSKPSNREDMMALFKDKALRFSPGTSWQYSNSGYMLLGYIIEAVTKKPYEKMVHDYIFTPLNMTHSGFDFTHLASNQKATGYFALNDLDTIIAPIVDSSVSFAAGAIYSTTGDLLKWHNAWQKNVILPGKLQELAHKPVKNNYGYGWRIDSTAGKRIVWHGGGIHGFSSNFSRIPEDDVCVVLLSNSSSRVLSDITKSIFAILYDGPYVLPKERQEIALPIEKLDQYTGEYQLPGELVLEISLRDSKLIAEPKGQRPAVLYGEKEDFFFVKEPDLQLQFTRNDKNEIDGFILHQGGRETKCRRIK